MAKIKQFQRQVRLEDSLAEEVIREATRATVESHLEKAIECLKRRTRVRDYSDLVKVRFTCVQLESPTSDSRFLETVRA